MTAHVLVGLAGGILILLVLAEFFVAFLLPRRVRRDPRIARGLFALTWRPWRALGRALPDAAGDTWLGFFGPLALIAELVIWALGLMVGYAALQWAFGSRVGIDGAGFGDDLYFSAGAFLSAAVSGAPVGVEARAISLAEAATGVAVLFSVIGYLPSVYAAFSRREIAVSQLDPRAGSPPSAGTLFARTAERSGWDELRAWLGDAEAWAAELMETHLSYPQLAYYRSQHVRQNWLAALTTIMDAAAVVIAALPEATAPAAETAYAVGRHALSDLAHQARARPRRCPRELDARAFASLRTALERSGRDLVDVETMRRRLDAMRLEYEPNASALAEEYALRLPDWLPAEPHARAAAGG